MNTAFEHAFIAHAEPHKYPQLPNLLPMYPLASPQMLSPQTVAASTPSLVARSLTSTPSSSVVAEDEIYRTDHGENDEIVVPHNSGSFHFDTEDDSQPWVTGKRLLPPVGTVSNRPPAPFVPNPYALKYIPTVTRRRYAASPANCERVQLSWRPHHAWLTPLRAGGVCQVNIARRNFAEVIVNAGPWDTSLISELAAKFIERAAEGLSSDSECVAPLARDVYRAFTNRHGGSPAEIFAQQLRQCLLSEFRAWWLQDMPSSIHNLSKLSPSPPHAHPYRQLSSALAVAQFAGDLFAQSLAAPHYLLLCMNMLLDRLSILEEVCALHAILYHAGEGMYNRLQTSDFVNKLQRRASRISAGATSVGHPDVVSEVARLVGEMTRLIDDWGKARATPSPSECSDVFSEYSDHNPDLANYHEVPLVSPTIQNALPAVPPGLRRSSERTSQNSCTESGEDERYVARTVVPLRTHDVSHSERAESSPPRDGCATPLVRPQARPAEHNRSWADIVKA